MSRDEHAAEHRCDENGDTAENGLNGEADGTPLAWERVAHDREQRRARHARPRHDEDDAKDDDRPGRRRRYDHVAYRGQAHEQHQRPPPAVMVAHPTARVLIKAIQQVLSTPVGTDCNDRCAERLEILGQEPAPEVFAERHEEHRADHGRGIPLEPECRGDPAETRRPYRSDRLRAHDLRNGAHCRLRWTHAYSPSYRRYVKPNSSWSSSVTRPSPRMIASRPGDSGERNLSSSRSASWTMAPISCRAGSVRS